MNQPEYKEFEEWFNSNIEATIKEDGSDNAKDIYISIEDFLRLPECMQRGVWEDWDKFPYKWNCN